MKVGAVSIKQEKNMQRATTLLQHFTSLCRQSPIDITADFWKRAANASITKSVSVLISTTHSPKLSAVVSRYPLWRIRNQRKQQALFWDNCFKSSLRFYFYVWFPTDSPQDSGSLIIKETNHTIHPLCVCATTYPSDQEQKDGFLDGQQLCWSPASQEARPPVGLLHCVSLGFGHRKRHLEAISCTPTGIAVLIASFRRVAVSTHVQELSYHGKREDTCVFVSSLLHHLGLHLPLP